MHIVGKAIIAIVAITLIVLVIPKGASGSSVPRGVGSAGGQVVAPPLTTQGQSPADQVAEILDQAESSASSTTTNCGPICRNLCKAIPAIKIKQRRRCINACKSDCTKGVDVRNKYP